MPIVIGTLGTVTKGLLKDLEDLEVSGRVEDYPNDSIAEGQARILETSPGDLRRLAVTQTPVKKLSANTDVKNSRGVNNDNNDNNQTL